MLHIMKARCAHPDCNGGAADSARLMPVFVGDSIRWIVIYTRQRRTDDLEVIKVTNKSMYDLQ